MSYIRTRVLTTDILYSISTDNYDDLYKLINEANVNNIIDKKNGFTALHYAIKFNNDKMIHLLLSMGADPEMKTLDGQNSFDLSLKYQTKSVINYSLTEKNEINNELKKVIKSLERKNVEVESNNKYLLKSVDEGTYKLNTLKTEINTLKFANTGLRTENCYLKKDLNTLSSEKISLQKKNTEITEENNILKPENENLTSQLKSLKRKYEKLDESYSGLLSKIQKK